MNRIFKLLGYKRKDINLLNIIVQNVSFVSKVTTHDDFRPEAEAADKEQKKEVETPKETVNAQTDAKDGEKATVEKMEH